FGLEDAVPDILGLGQHCGGELAHLVARARLDTFIHRHLSGAGQTAARQYCQRIDAAGSQREEQHDEDDDGGEAQAAGSASHRDADRISGAAETTGESSASGSPPVLDIAALTTTFPAHDFLLVLAGQSAAAPRSWEISERSDKSY